MPTSISTAATRLAHLPERISGAPAPDHLISLDRGDPDFPTPEPVVEAMMRALKDGYTHYGDLNGDPELRAHIAEQVSAMSGAHYDDWQVVITPGSTAGLSAAIHSLVNPGDRVVLFDPGYPAYAEQVALAGGVVVRVPYRPDGALDHETLQVAAEGAKLLVLCHPANPTGVVFTSQDLQRLASCVERTGTIVLADEAYADIVYDGRPFTSTMQVAGLRSRLVYCRTFSKSFAMAGWRLGYLVLPVNLAPAIKRLHMTYNGAVNAAVQRAGLVALRSGPELVAPMLAEYQRRRDLLMSWVERTGLLQVRAPQATFYAYGRYRHDACSLDVVRHLVGHGVLVRAGAYDGPCGEQHLRVSFALGSDVLAEALNRLEKGLQALPAYQSGGAA
jgi:aspartate aminotransferase